MNRGNRISRHPHCAAGAHRGFSLIEILVVLVVLLIGILAIVRLFPGGFLTIQRTGELTAAQALSAQQLDDVRSLIAPPEAVGSALPDSNGNIIPIGGIRPDDLATSSTSELANLATAYNFTLPNGYGPYYFSDINRIRFIQGETFRIPVATPNSVLSSKNGSVYVLQYGPVYNVFHTDPNNSNAPADSLNVYGAALTRVVADSTVSSINNPNPVPDLHDTTEFAIDYANRRIAFFPRSNIDSTTNQPRQIQYRTFILKFQAYSLNAGNNEVLSNYTLNIKVPDLDLTVSPDQPVWQDIFDANLTTVVNPPNTTPGQLAQTVSILPGTDVVTPKFRLVSTSVFNNPNNAPPFTDDPYEYAWYSPQAPNAGGTANLGVLIFNPHGHVSFLNPNATDAAAKAYINQLTITARIDYLTFDNHIIRDDRSIPGGTPYRIKLSVPLIWSNGDPLPTQYNYTGIYTDPTVDNSSVTGVPDLVIVNMNTGQELGDVIGGVSTAASLISATVDAKNGIITFADTTTDKKGINDLGLQNAPLRFFYRADRDWGMQVQKASSHYTQVPTIDAVTSNTFFVGDGTNGTLQTRLYFDKSESGKTINIGEFFYYTGAQAPNDPSAFQHPTNQTFQINDNPAQYTTVTGKQYTWIDLKDVDANATSFSSLPTGRAVNFVQGASLRSRVVWHDVNRWRRVDNDTILQSNNQ